MKAFYVDLVRGSKFSLLAGPFPDETTARRYQSEAVKLAVELDPWADFDAYGVVSITEHRRPGVLNSRLEIDPADLLPKKEDA